MSAAGAARSRSPVSTRAHSAAAAAAGQAASSAAGRSSDASEETRFQALLAELRVQFGPRFNDAGQPGFSREGAVAALRAIIGNSTVTAAERSRGFRGSWSGPLQVRVGAVLSDIAGRSTLCASLVAEVLAPRSMQRHAWLNLARQLAADELARHGQPSTTTLHRGNQYVIMTRQVSEILKTHTLSMGGW